MILNSKIPEGPLDEKWTRYKKTAKLVNAANRKKLDVIVIGTGLALLQLPLGRWGIRLNPFVFRTVRDGRIQLLLKGG